MKYIFTLTIVIIAFFACNTPLDKKPSFDLVKAKAEIATSNKEFESYVSKGDSVGLATNIYTVDAKFMGPNQEAAVGRPQVLSAISSIFQSGITGIKLTTADVWGDENSIVEEGAFELNIKDGTVVEKGKYLVLWKKEDGKWKLFRDCFNSNQPIPLPAK